MTCSYTSTTGCSSVRAPIPHRISPPTRPLSGFRTGPNVTWGNLCACMDTLVALASGYKGFFQPKQPSTDESIPWDLQSRRTFGNSKAYDFLGAYIPRQYLAFFFRLTLLSSLIPGTDSSPSSTGKHPLRTNITTTTSQKKQGGHSLQDANLHSIDWLPIPNDTHWQSLRHFHSSRYLVAGSHHFFPLRP